ncbi:MAG: putative baseplate assembly protein, partial [Crocosphaera sp.]|nr:putative baseplate assembly protein [Crocosphaera sp.]
PQPGNCYYIVLDSNPSLAGNVIALTFKGEAATSTGIKPDHPPRRWEAWDGKDWQPVLLTEKEDRTDGLSFSQLTREGGNPFSGADVILHLPLSFPSVQRRNYQGHWLRCVYTRPGEQQTPYLRSPKIVGLNVRSLGGTVPISQEIVIHEEILGKSNGKPGQRFKLQVTPVLPRNQEEYLLVTPPEGLPQRWQEVNDFAESGPGDRHYTLNGLTGEIQLGPLIKEPSQLAETTRLRSYLQRGTEPPNPQTMDPLEQQPLERQYGSVPPKGATLTMIKYRTGGGHLGNVQAKTITIVKSAVPYVSGIINHQPTYNGADAESLEDVVIRVPRLLRTQNRAVTAEDFETLAYEAGKGAIARVRCLFPPANEEDPLGNQSLVEDIERYQALNSNDQDVTLPNDLVKKIKNRLRPPSRSQLKSGQIRLLLVSSADLTAIERREGIHPQRLAVAPFLLNQIKAYLDERRLLGVEVQYDQPNYVGVSVQTEIALEPEYNTPTAKKTILNRAEIALYRFLNPITGGTEGTGWPFGRPVYASDIVKLLQTISGVRYIGTVQLFELRRRGDEWQRSLPNTPEINPGANGLICSWQNNDLRSSHIVNAKL